jgi:hypothetical protein
MLKERKLIMQRLFLFSLFLVILSFPGLAKAQAVVAEDLSRLALENTDVLAREERIGNMERLKTPVLPLAGENQPPTLNISPETRTIRVGQQVTFRFAFGDPENDPYFAGVIAVTPRLRLERLNETRKQSQRAASIKIDVLTPDDPATVVWNITAQNPGVAVFFVSIAELFASQEDGNLKFSSGKISHVAYILRVVGDTDEGSTPQFIDRLGDIRLRLKERTSLAFAAQSSEGRPLTYGFLFLAYASRLVSGRIGLNLLDLKAVDPGKGIFVAYVTDGRKADIQTFMISVIDPAKEPVESTLKLRTLSANAAAVRTKPIKLDLYGENFTPSSQVILSTADGEQRLAASLVSPTDLHVELPPTLRDIVSLRVVDGDSSTDKIPFRILRPVITDLKRARNDRGVVEKIRIFGLGVGRKVRVTANGEELEQLKDNSVHTKFGDQVVVVLPSRLRGEQSIELRLTNDAGLESFPINLPLIK